MEDLEKGTSMTAIPGRLRHTVLRVLGSRVFLCIYILVWLALLVWVFFRWNAHVVAKVLASLLLTIFGP
jgi:hypothetical protein